MVANTWAVSSNNGGTWTTIPTPTTWTWSYFDLSSDDSGRSLDGAMHKDIVAVKRKNECTWQNVSASVAKSIMNPSKAGVFILLRFYDLYLGGVISTVKVYTGDITATAHNAYGQTVFDVSLNFIQQ